MGVGEGMGVPMGRWAGSSVQGVVAVARRTVRRHLVVVTQAMQEREVERRVERFLPLREG